MTTRRLNINVPDNVYQELQELAQDTGHTMTEVMRTAFGLAKVAFTEVEKGNSVVIAKPDGTPIKEILIPR